MIGKTISHYRILEKLGEGGMGVVYKAEDTKLKRTVALKFLPQQDLGDEEEKTRFVHEAQAAAALDHPNICTVYEIDELEGQTFIAMAYIEGQILKEKIESGPLKLKEALEISLQVAEGLQEAHEKGIVHRDIKSANIMITSKGKAKIMDFGLAKLSRRTRITKTGTTMGTVAYMSPEQARGEDIDHRTDIWSLAVVIYEMVTGQLPFKGEYEQAVVYSIINEEPEPMTGLRTGVPMELEHVVNKAIAKNPGERYQHTDELLTDLRRIQKILADKSAVQVGAADQPRWQRRLVFPVIWTMIIVLFGLAIGVLLYYPRNVIPFTERDWILITDFENLTEEEIFDKSLNTALAVSIEQSSYINVFPRRRIEETLKRMKKEKVRKIDEDIGREIAEREGINILVVPSISQVGDTYALTGKIQNANTGSTLKSEIIQILGKDEVLNALDKLSKKIRKDLGESLEAISKQSKPLKKVTTSSLEALKQYSLGIENHWNANFEEARLYYESALQIDSTFTAAKASLGIINFEKFDREKGKKLLAEAVLSVDDLTDREKYSILAFHTRTVENDLEKAINYLKMLLVLYPDYEAAHNNLGWYFSQMGQYEDAIAEYKKALRINPYLMLTYNGLNWTYLYNLGELDSALVWCKRQITYNDRYASAYNNLGWAYLGKDSLEQAAQAFKKALELDPKHILVMFRLSDTYRLQGLYQEAVRPLQRIIEIDSTESWAKYQLGLLYQLLGDEKTARQYFKRFHKDAKKWLRDDPGKVDNYIALGLVLTRTGEKERGWAMIQKAITVDSTKHFRLAQLLCVLGKKQEALDQLELAVQKGFTNYIWMKIHPDLQTLYGEPRFIALMNRVLKRSV